MADVRGGPDLVIAAPAPAPAPATHRSDTVDVLHGVEVPDPYRWLETESPETDAWVAAQNERTSAVLDALPDRPRLHASLTRLLRSGSSVACRVAGTRVFSLERWGNHDQAVLVVRTDRKPGKAKTVIDPSELTGDATAAIDWYHPSPDGRLVAYGMSVGGDERSTLYLFDVEAGVHTRDRIPHTRAASVAWAPKGDAFAYTRYPDPADVEDGDDQYWRKVYWHRLGEPWESDELIWGDLPDKTAWPNITISKNGRWLLVHVSLGWSRIDVHLLDLSTGSRTVLIEGIDAVSSFEIVGQHVIGLTTLDADRGRVVRAPLAKAWHANWETIVAESDSVIDAVASTSGSLLVLSSRSAVSRLDRYDHEGGGHEPVALPDMGSLAGLSGSPDHDLAFFSFTSFATPAATWRWTRTSVEEWSRLGDVDGAAAEPQGRYVVQQVRYPSTDGTEIPMFLVYAAGTQPTADTPCVLTGYGGFSISLGPTYSAAVVAVCDAGGIYAVANIRGGAEEGEAWHRAGMRENKQQSFDDFIAAADWLVSEGFTSRKRLAIRGGSNGGLLMGAAVTQRPDLCAAVQIAVPLLDMLRYHRFLIARLWIPEYGDPDRAEDFGWLHAYSPYHRVVDGTCYPATLLTSAEGDSRVDPLHARKMAARLQAATSCPTERPILLRQESRAGHGQGKPVSKQADELADALGFLLWQTAR